jgi:translocation and assembly module TamB
LKFTRGKVTFAGSGVDRALDPLLDLVAESTAGNVTAKLAMTGSARAPKIVLTSTPELPQDEVLSRLIFGESVKELTPLQLVQIASAVATLSGMTGGGPGTLAQVQRQLGLDRLSVGAGPSGNGASVEAGRYVSDRVYVGARESTSGTTQARVQVDLTKHLKVQTTIGTGGSSVQGVTPENDPGSSVGFVYQIDY